MLLENLKNAASILMYNSMTYGNILPPLGSAWFMLEDTAQKQWWEIAAVGMLAIRHLQIYPENALGVTSDWFVAYYLKGHARLRPQEQDVGCPPPTILWWKNDRIRARQ